ncbi:hypothetical protein BY996DRAFT_4585118, partial [Phakopsora pachyrhizi]
GSPPFSFTYTRRSPMGRGNKQRVLETQTVTVIKDYGYSIFAREEGTCKTKLLSHSRIFSFFEYEKNE